MTTYRHLNRLLFCITTAVNLKNNRKAYTYTVRFTNGDDILQVPTPTNQSKGYMSPKSWHIVASKGGGVPDLWAYSFPALCSVNACDLM